MTALVVGTAGHVDHGKTALVRALTGIDCDRLPEEKRRGITLDLGFAHLERDGVEIGFVDVPGHERLLHNALALARSNRGLAPRARRDLGAATRAGQFAVADPELAMTVVAGATLCLGQLLHDQPDRNDAEASDQVAGTWLFSTQRVRFSSCRSGSWNFALCTNWSG